MIFTRPVHTWINIRLPMKYMLEYVSMKLQIDIRRFYDGNPSNEGITLSQMQWHYLKSSVDHMDESILKSRTHL